MKPKQTPLNLRQRAFAVAYASLGPSLGNGSKAARMAGYSEKTAGQTANALLKDPRVQAVIAKEAKERFKRLQMSGDEVLARLAMLSRTDVRKLFRDDGGHKLPHELDDETAATVAAVDTELTFDGDGAPPTAVRKYKLRDPTPALRTLAQYHKLIGADVQVNVGAVIAERLAEARRRARARDG